jgi:alkanesulfonate monooxygenase SsuD/methylene tetrahydromethanopterin reductase-like flavin-dependent oxidoreductase (luciferase family)
LGTACLVTATRNPLYLSLEWSTLDHLSNGRTILGACMGNPEKGVQREFAALGLDYAQRAEIFEEGLAILRQLWTDGAANFDGKHFHYDNIRFHSGTEMAPLKPLQTPPPIWVVSNPRLVVGTRQEDKTSRVIDRASQRIAAYGDGWMTCCRAGHPDEFRQQRESIEAALRAAGRTPDGFVLSYQVTFNIADSREAAQRSIGDYIEQYYPELSKAMDLSEWGPMGTPDDIIAWIRSFAEAGVNYFICRFGALDQFGQVRRFAEEVLPAFAG